MYHIRGDVRELLHAGLSDTEIARQLGIDRSTPARARAALGLPKPKRGKRPAATPEDLFWKRVKPSRGGHMEWTGYAHGGTPSLRHGGQLHTAYRLAFRIANGRDPEGYALPSCGREHCVKPGHHADRVDRDREKRIDDLYDGIFGQATA